MEIKKLFTLLENKLGNNRLLLLLTYYNENRHMLINRIHFDSINTEKGSFNIASNGNNVCRVFFKNNKFSVDSLWDVAKYKAPYFNIKRVKVKDNTQVLPNHLAALRNLFLKSEGIDSIAETVAAINIALNNYPMFAAYAISQKKIYLKKIFDIPTRKSVAQYIDKVNGNETINIPEYLKGFKFSFVENPVITKEENTISTENKIINLPKIKNNSRRKVMLMAHAIRKNKLLTDKNFSKLKYREQMSYVLTLAWKEIKNNNEIIEEAAVSVDETVENNIVNTQEEKHEPKQINDITPVETEDNNDEYIIDLFRNPRFKENNKLAACNTVQCRKNKDCLYLVTYKFGFAIEDYQGNIFQCLPTKKVERITANNCLLTDPRSFKKVFNKLFGEDPIMIQEHLHQSVSIPKIRFEGKVYTLIIFGYDNLDTFSPDIAENVMNAKEDK